MMKEAEIFGELAKIFAELFPDQTVVLSRELTAADVDGWDSVRHMNLILATELAFGIRLTLRQIESISGLGDLVELIEAKTS